MSLSEFAARAEALAVPLGIAAMSAVWAWDAYLRWRLPRHETDTAHGSAHWAINQEVATAGLLADRGLWVGRWHGHPLRIETDRHLCTLAPTRSGKGVAAILPNLLTYPGSMIVIDPKGESVAIAARRRKEMGQAVYVVDPWHITKHDAARFNPLARLEGADLAEDADLLAAAMVPEGKGEGKHWADEGRAILKGLILHVVTTEPMKHRHLGRVRYLLTLPAARFSALIAAMMQSNAAGGLVARAASVLAQKPDRERASVISTATSNTNFLDSERLGVSLSASDFCFGDLKSQPVTVFLVLPADRLVAYGRWLRLMITQALTELVRRPGRPPQPVLFILDEFAALGQLEPVETAMGLLAGFGVQLWPILQDLSQLQKNYPHSWATFLANAGVVQAFSVADTITAAWLSERLGQRTVAVRQQSMAGATIGGVGDHSYSQGHSVTARALMTPDELTRLSRGKQILVLPGNPPLLCDMLSYYRDREFKGHYDPNPWLKNA